MKCPVCQSSNIKIHKVSQSNNTTHVYSFCQECGQNKAIPRDSIPDFHNQPFISYVEAKAKFGKKK